MAIIHFPALVPAAQAAVRAALAAGSFTATHGGCRFTIVDRDHALARRDLSAVQVAIDEDPSDAAREARRILSALCAAEAAIWPATGHGNADADRIWRDIRATIARATDAA